MEPFSLNLQILRKSRGLKQGDMQAFVGIKRTTWNNYETGLSEPNLEGLKNIAIFFDISIDDLLNKDLSLDKNLLSKIDSLKKRIKNHSTDKPFVNEEVVHYNSTQQNENKDEIIHALKETVETQKELIATLKTTIASLENQLNTANS